MLKLFLFSILLVAFTGNTIYHFKISGINGQEIDLRSCQGKKILLVNTASQSRYVYQVGNLEKLHEKYKDKLVIIAVPSNSFGKEPESQKAIESLFRNHYGAQYLVASKMDVTGSGVSQLYKWLGKSAENGVMNTEVEGDFYKYLIGGNGKLIGYFVPGVDPLDSIVLRSIENPLLDK